MAGLPRALCYWVCVVRLLYLFSFLSLCVIPRVFYIPVNDL